MHSHLDFELSRARAVEMHREVEHNRLKSRLAEAHRAKGVLSAEGLSPRRGMVARSAAIVMALFR